MYPRGTKHSVEYGDEVISQTVQRASGRRATRERRTRRPLEDRTNSDTDVCTRDAQHKLN